MICEEENIMTFFDQALPLIREALAGKDRVIIAIDGPCGSGKTTLAEALSQELDCPVIHMDQFFLRPEQRTPERLAEPGGNVDRERFLTEVLIPLKEGKDFAYSPFSCRTMSLAAPVAVKASPVTIVEGSYACHPELRDAYDLRLFLAVDPAEQLRRLVMRDGEGYLPVFKEKWIPMEELYHDKCGVREACEILTE